jgi:hypothetical protein
MRRRIIEALTYPRMLMISRMDLQDCPMHRYYSADQQACQTCDQGGECHWLNSNEEFSVLIEQPIEALFEAFVFSIDYVDAHISRDGHNFRHCTCETCTWAKDARHLERRYKGHAAKVSGRPSMQENRHSDRER